MNRFIFITMVVFAWIITAETSAETIQVYSYHNHPPFVNSEGIGLTYDLVNFLNQHSNGKYFFKTRILPRKRLNLKIKQPGPWIVNWVHPLWFGDKEEKKYLWVDLFEDTSVIISNSNKKVEYKGPASLKGLKFGGIGGHRYGAIDDLVAKGLLTRIDGDHEKDILRVLLRGRLDVILLPGSTINYLKNEMSLEKKIYIPKKHHQIYMRKFMIPNTRKDLKQYLSDLQLSNNRKWQSLLEQYGLNNQ